MVGCGGISHFHARAAQNSPSNVVFAACCDIDENRARAWAAEYGCPAVHTDLVEMIQAEGLDGVLLATWPNQHLEQVLACLRAGARYILCEKALTLTGEDAVTIWDEATRAGAVVMEGFMYRHHPSIRRLELLLSSGELGPVDSVRAAFSAYDAEDAPVGDANRNWRQRAECGGGVPYDFACYAVNACGHFCGDIPVRVFAVGSKGKYDTVNRMHGMIEYANGRAGYIHSSKKATFNQELQIECAQGSLYLPTAWATYGAETSITVRRSPKWAYVLEDRLSIESADPWQMQLQNLAAVIRREAEPLLSLAESVVHTCTTEALVTSLVHRCMVEVRVPDRVSRAYAETLPLNPWAM